MPSGDAAVVEAAYSELGIAMHLYSFTSGSSLRPGFGSKKIPTSYCLASLLSRFRSAVLSDVLALFFPVASRLNITARYTQTCFAVI